MSTLKANTISNVAGSQSISTDRVAQGTAAAWVNFNGTGTVAIRASYNVTSITDNTTGDYTLNFTSSISDTNYAVVGTCDASLASANNPRSVQFHTFATGSCRIQTNDNTGVAEDEPYICVAIFR